MLEMTWKQKIYLLLTDPLSSKAAMAIQMSMFSLIFLSITSFIVGTRARARGQGESRHHRDGVSADFYD